MLSSLIITKRTIDNIIERARDVHEEVRRLTFKLIGEKIIMRNLRSDQIIQLLSNGLQDRDSQVRDLCKLMLTNWFDQLGNDLIKFVKYLEIEDHADTAEQALCVLFDEDNGTNAGREVIESALRMLRNQQELSGEMVFVWRVYCKQHEEEVEEQAEKYLPELSEFCGVIQRLLASSPPCEFVLSQLFLLSPFLDASDEVGRKYLSLLLKNTLISPDTPHSLIGPIFIVLQSLHPSIRDLAQIIFEMIAIVREPLVQLDSPDQSRQLDQLQNVRAPPIEFVVVFSHF